MSEVNFKVHRQVLENTCDQIITPARKAKVCSISFSALRPAYTKKSPAFCIQERGKTAVKEKGSVSKKNISLQDH